MRREKVGKGGGKEADEMKRRKRRRKRRKKMRMLKKRHRKGKLYSLKTLPPRTNYSHLFYSFQYIDDWHLLIY